MQNENYFKTFDWLLDEKYRVAYHFLFWTLIFSDEILSFLGLTDEFFAGSFVFFSIAILVIFVYLNLYYLIPHFLFKNDVKKYFIYSVLAFIVYLISDFLIVYPIFCEECQEDMYSPFTILISTTISTATILGTAIGINIFKRYIKDQQRIKDLETTGLKTELAYLKEQINPHFLFNSLNNIFVQSKKRPEEVPESIMTLSDLLRYQLYDCSHEKVKLRDEINYLKNYLTIDKMRKLDENVELEIKGEVNGVLVAPFLFIPFVENAVKHGINLDGKSYINILFELSNDTLLFKIENSKSPQTLQSKSGGIGLKNVQRRLDLLYPNKHTLALENLAEKFIVNLQLKL